MKTVYELPPDYKRVASQINPKFDHSHDNRKSLTEV